MTEIPNAIGELWLETMNVSAAKAGSQLSKQRQLSSQCLSACGFSDTEAEPKETQGKDQVKTGKAED